MLKWFYQKVPCLSAAEQSEAAHSLLIKELAAYFRKDPRLLEIHKDERGAPFIPALPGIHVSLSHTGGMVACAFSDVKVGIDVEKIRARRKAVERRVFTQEEISLIDNSSDPDKEFFTLWTLKESYLKSVGTGFAGNAKDISFSQTACTIVSDRRECSFICREHEEYLISVCETNI